MLVLTVALEGEIYIGDVRVKVLGHKGRGVQLGIDAPRDVPVDRAEVRERKLREDVRGEGGA